jgi:hypothetical protein
VVVPSGFTVIFRQLARPTSSCSSAVKERLATYGYAFGARNDDWAPAAQGRGPRIGCGKIELPMIGMVEAFLDPAKNSTSADSDLTQVNADICRSRNIFPNSTTI